MSPRTPIAQLPHLPCLSVTHDASTNVAYVYLTDRRTSGGSHHCHSALDRRVVFDMDAQERILGIELLDARMLRPETIAEAARTPRSIDDQLDPLDRKVFAACLGDHLAIAELFRSHKRLLLAEAEDVLGVRHQHDAEDVVQDLWMGFTHRSFRFPVIRGAGLAWLRRTVRALANEQLRRVGAR